MHLLHGLRRWWRIDANPSAQIAVSTQRVVDSANDVKDSVEHQRKRGTLEQIRRAISDAAERDERRMRGD